MSLSVEKCLQAWTNSLRQMNAKADIVFLGDSMTYYGDFSSVFPDKVVCNLGLRGDTIQGMIDRVEQVKMLEPKVVYLLAGINDEVCDLDGFREKYKSLINQLLRQVPGANIIIQSLMPVNDIQFKISCNNRQIIVINKVIEDLCCDNSIRYMDLFTIYQKDGLLPEHMTMDGIHLKRSAYEKWYTKLKNNEKL